MRASSHSIRRPPSIAAAASHSSRLNAGGPISPKQAGIAWTGKSGQIRILNAYGVRVAFLGIAQSAPTAATTSTKALAYGLNPPATARELIELAPLRPYV